MTTRYDAPMKVWATLGMCLAACGGAATPNTATATSDRPAGSCLEAQALAAPGKRDNAPGYRAGVVCDDGACTLTVSHDAVTRSHPTAPPADPNFVGVRRADLDGDGGDELMVLITNADTRSLTVLDAATLESRWSAPDWTTAAACTSEAELRDDDCDDRRETLIQLRRCDGATDERLPFRAAAPGARFLAAEPVAMAPRAAILR